MSKNKHKKKNSQSVTKEEQPVIPANNHLLNWIGIGYFIAMACFSYFVLYLNNSPYSDLITTVLFIGYFALMFFISRKQKREVWESIKIPFNLLFIILGAVLLFNFVATSLSNWNSLNIQSQNMYDIEQYATEVYNKDKIQMFTDIDNSRFFVINNKSEFDKVAAFDMVEESKFDSTILNDTSKFFKLGDNLKFSYLINNEDNEVVVQYTHNDKRYLSKITATNLIEILTNSDEYSNPLIETDNYKIFKIEGPAIMLYIDESTIQASEYDTITDLKGSEHYIARIYTFLENHYDKEYIEGQNASAELISETKFGDMKLNLYTMSCYSCSYRYGKTDIAEINMGDTTYIFNLNINSEIVKEAKLIEADN